MVSPILETDRLRIFYRKNMQGPLLITFSGLAFRKPDSFLGDTPSVARAFTRIGIVAKGAHWYPRIEMERYLGYLTEIAARHDEVICCGEDAGGYAALKYSGALGATLAIAINPHVSVAPEDTRGFDGRQGDHFDPALHSGMAIDAEDLCRTAYVVYDPRDPQDRGHADSIARAAPVLPVAAPYCGGTVADMLIGRDHFVDLIEMARRGFAPNRLEKRIRLLKKGWPLYYLRLADDVAKHGRPDVAIRLLERARILDRTNFHILLRLGVLQRRLKRLNEAEAIARTLVECHPGSAHSHSLLAGTLMDKGALNEAYESLETALTINPGVPHLHVRFSVLLDRLGHREQAIAALEAALNRFPGNETIQTHLDRIRGQEPADAAPPETGQKPDAAAAHTL